MHGPEETERYGLNSKKFAGKPLGSSSTNHGAMASVGGATCTTGLGRVQVGGRGRRVLGGWGVLLRLADHTQPLDERLSTRSQTGSQTNKKTITKIDPSPRFLNGFR